jgi:hypothetical protein
MSISGHDLRAGTAENYRAFAAEAHGRSALYAELATAVADDPLVLTFLDKLPAAKRQPNLLFAAACYLSASPPISRRCAGWSMAVRTSSAARCSPDGLRPTSPLGTERGR